RARLFFGGCGAEHLPNSDRTSDQKSLLASPGFERREELAESKILRKYLNLRSCQALAHPEEDTQGPNPSNSRRCDCRGCLSLAYSDTRLGFRSSAKV